MKKRPLIGLMVLRQMLGEVEKLSKFVDFFQVPAEEYIGPQTLQDIDTLKHLSRLRPLHIHSIDFSFCSADGPGLHIIPYFKKLMNEVQIETLSDHLGFSTIDGLWTGMPILNVPYTNEAAEVVVQNINIIQSKLGIKFPILLENNSHCIDWPNSNLSETDFINKITDSSNIKILLDITNMFADSQNYSFDPKNYIDGLKKGSVNMVHVAGGDWLDGYKDGVITRGHHKPVEDSVWDLLKYVVSRHEPKYIVLERSRNIDYGEIIADLSYLQEITN